MATPIADAHWEGIVAHGAGRPVADNPYSEATAESAAWLVGYLTAAEADEHDALPETQVQEAIAEQPRWERRELLGINELVRRVHERVDGYARFFGAEVDSAVLVRNARRLLTQSVQELVNRRTESEERFGEDDAA